MKRTANVNANASLFFLLADPPLLVLPPTTQAGVELLRSRETSEAELRVAVMDSLARHK